jgi:hypothetical protein
MILSRGFIESSVNSDAGNSNRGLVMKSACLYG